MRKWIGLAALVWALGNAALADLSFQAIPERTPPLAFFYPDGSPRRIADNDIVAYSHEWADTSGHGLYATIEFEAVVHGETTGFYSWENPPAAEYFFKKAGTDSIFDHPQYYRMGQKLAPAASVESLAIVSGEVHRVHYATGDTLVQSQADVKSNVILSRHVQTGEIEADDVAAGAIGAVKLDTNAALSNLTSGTDVGLTGATLGSDSLNVRADTLTANRAYIGSELDVQSGLFIVDDASARLTGIPLLANTTGSDLRGDVSVGTGLSNTLTARGTVHANSSVEAANDLSAGDDLIVVHEADLGDSLAVADSLSGPSGADSAAVALRVAHGFIRYPDGTFPITYPSSTTDKSFSVPGVKVGDFCQVIRMAPGSVALGSLTGTCAVDGVVRITASVSSFSSTALGLIVYRP